MPRYLVTSQTTLVRDAPARASRNDASSGATFDIVTADSLLTAATVFHQRSVTSPNRPRLVSVEELFDIDPHTLTDEALVGALTSAEPAVDLDGYGSEDAPLYDEPDDFLSAVCDVVDALRNSDVVPGLTITLSRDYDGVADYCMVEIADGATRSYRAAGSELRGLIEDSRLSGRDAVISIARAIVLIAFHHHLL